ncbi:MAG: acetolactate synthase large subunit [Actinomycetota bacterium]|nr:thiamine pyrophosphate-binding protein [Cryptosporangiaceae bacterium]MDQ1675977.1 acetolactate synthase large subunit [Actinomycetota bacterium]
MKAPELAAVAAKALSDVGSDIMFGVPGGGNNLEMIGAAEAAGIRFVLAHGETAATIMAAVYGDLTRRPAACIVTRGPGAASAVNGAAQALLDRQPLLLLTDAVSSAERQRVSHQRLDQTAMLAAVTKSSGTLGRHDAVGTIEGALALAIEAPPGPVHLDFDPAATSAVVSPLPAPAASPEAATERLLGYVAASRRPAILLGVGARGASAQIRDLVRGTGIPVLMTYRAKGIVPDSWPNSGGLLTGATVEAPILEAADLLVAIGLDTVELIPNAWAYEAPVVSLSSWPEDSPYFAAQVEVVGDLGALVGRLTLADGWPAGFAADERGRGVARLVDGPAPEDGLAPTDVVARTRAIAPAGTIATVDAGAHMLAAMPLWDTEEPDEVLISSGLATMGFALPAAVAAALAYPDRRTVCFVGDGGLGMALAELETVARLGLPITVVVFNDSALSLIALKQKSDGHGGSGATAYRETDFAMIGEGSGIPSVRVARGDDLDRELARTFAADGPALLDVRVDPRGYPHIMTAIRGPRQR